MKLVIGIDTGGTYTDAVLLDKSSNLVKKKSKAITTPHDLSIGIAQAMDGLGKLDYSQVQMVSISTTLATNAIVEGQGGRVALFLVGYDREWIEQQGLARKLPVQAMYFIAGGHNVKGEEICPLDCESAFSAIQEIRANVDAFAVSGYFSVMNPDHELHLRKIILDQTTAPVVCGHELTNKLNAIKRVSTAVLNARLLPLVSHLLDSVKKVLKDKGCQARLMVVKGDGTLISENMARLRPVETILSGPAASAIGAEFLANQSDAVVVDMGGTTTDIAILENGLPWSNPNGASVGGWQTSVKAADLRTIGIGGDSHIRIEGKTLLTGPRRAIPLFRLGLLHPEIVQELEKAKNVNWELEGIQPTDYLSLVNSIHGLTLTQAESTLIQQLQDRPQSIISLKKEFGIHPIPSERLEQSGYLRRYGLTPSDLLWPLSKQTGGNGEAARVGSEVVARQLDIPDEELALRVVEQIVGKIAEEILDKLVIDLTNHSLLSAPQSWRRLLGCLLGYQVHPSLSGYIQVHKPIIAIGAPVASFIPKVAEKLHTQCIIPPHSEVGNAVGAAVASISHTVEILVQPQVLGSGTLVYLVHSPSSREVLNDQSEAVSRAELIATQVVADAIRQAGEERYSVKIDKQIVELGTLTEVTVRACATTHTIGSHLMGNKPEAKNS